MVKRMTAEQDAARVGREIRNLRRAKRLTLQQLSSEAGLSIGFLSQIERGHSSPSVKAMHSIASALGVTIGWFFRADAEANPELSDLVVRSGSRRRIRFEGGIQDELLCPDLGGKLELLESRLAPRSSSGQQTYRHEGEEAGIVLRGQLDLWVGEKHARLNPGDSFAFDSSQPHRYANCGDEETVVIWAITPPSY